MFKLAKNIHRHMDKIQSFTHKYLILFVSNHHVNPQMKMKEKMNSKMI